MEEFLAAISQSRQRAAASSKTFLAVSALASAASTSGSSDDNNQVVALQTAIAAVFDSNRVESVEAAATNNFAICCLHVKKVGLAVSKLESLIAEDPVVYMTDPLVFNLCTLYDLAYAPDISNTKKKTLQNVAAAYNIVDPVLQYRSFHLH